MYTKDMTFNKKIFYNLAELDAAYIIKLAEIIEVLDFEPPIIENPPCDIDSEDDEVIKPTEDIQRNQPNASLSEGVERISQINSAEPDNPYPLPKETISNQETLLSINNFKSTKKGNNNNNNNTTINKKRIDINLNKVYILPKNSKQEKRAQKGVFFTTQYNNSENLDTYHKAFIISFKQSQFL